jgi:hypothetical protein
MDDNGYGNTTTDPHSAGSIPGVAPEDLDPDTESQKEQKERRKRSKQQTPPKTVSAQEVNQARDTLGKLIEEKKQAIVRSVCNFNQINEAELVKMRDTIATLQAAHDVI